MIYLTGDTHGGFQRLNSKNFPEQKEMTKDDYLIICGDFGGVWEAGEENKEEKHWLDWLEDKSFTVLFVDGNHENFDRLNAYPVREWKGGKIHEIRPHVFHLMRGQIYEICQKTIFTFGGASSHDISGGILEPDDPNFAKKKKRLNREWAPYRINHISWWKEELPSDEEMEEGFRNLELHNNMVDYIITHCCPTSVQAQFRPDRLPDKATEYLEKIKERVDYQKWFFGHYHSNLNISPKELLIYEQIIRIA